MKIVDIANEIYLELGSPTDLSIPAIAFWVRSNVGALNSALNESFQIDSTTLEIVDENAEEISEDAVAIIKKLYDIHTIKLDIRKSLNAVSTDAILEVRDEGSSVKKVNKADLMKTLTSAKKDALQELGGLVNGYKIKRAKPKQVAGDDTVEGFGLKNHTLSTRSSII